MSVVGDNNTEQSYEHFYLLLFFFFFFLPAIANSYEIAETSLGVEVVKENPEALEREGKWENCSCSVHGRRLKHKIQKRGTIIEK